MQNTFLVHPIGWIHKAENNITIDIDPLYGDALLGLESFSHIQVLYWFHEHDDAENRSILQVHPRKNPQNPLTGKYAKISRMIPNTDMWPIRFIATSSFQQGFDWEKSISKNYHRLIWHP